MKLINLTCVLLLLTLTVNLNIKRNKSKNSLAYFKEGKLQTGNSTEIKALYKFDKELKQIEILTCKENSFKEKFLNLLTITQVITDDRMNCTLSTSYISFRYFNERPEHEKDIKLKGTINENSTKTNIILTIEPSDEIKYELHKLFSTKKVKDLLKETITEVTYVRERLSTQIMKKAYGTYINSLNHFTPTFNCTNETITKIKDNFKDSKEETLKCFNFIENLHNFNTCNFIEISSLVSRKDLESLFNLFNIKTLNSDNLCSHYNNNFFTKDNENLKSHCAK